MGFDPPLIEPGRLTLPAFLEAQDYETAIANIQKS
jgi:hypothetical protein